MAETVLRDMPARQVETRHAGPDIPNSVGVWCVPQEALGAQVLSVPYITTLARRRFEQRGTGPPNADPDIWARQSKFRLCVVRPPQSATHARQY